jgi:hypothetical protein
MLTGSMLWEITRRQDIDMKTPMALVAYVDSDKKDIV